MATVTTERNIGVSIILTIFTCGIYGIFWFISLTDEIRNASEDSNLPSGGMAFLLTLVTCGIYGLFWAYQMGKGLASAHRLAGDTVVSDNSILYLILQIFGFGIINFAIMQNDLNQLSRKAYSQKVNHRHDEENE